MKSLLQEERQPAVTLWRHTAHLKCSQEKFVAQK